MRLPALPVLLATALVLLAGCDSGREPPQPVGAPAARPPARGACTSRDYERDHCTGDSINEGREAVFELEADRQRRELEDARESGYRSGYDDGYERGHEDGTSGW